MILEARKRKDLTGKELGLRLGYKGSAAATVVSSWERACKPVPLGKIGKLCRLLGIDEAELTRLCAAHKWGPLDQAVREGVVAERLARYGAPPLDAPLSDLVHDAEAVRRRNPATFDALCRIAADMAKSIEPPDKP